MTYNNLGMQIYLLKPRIIKNKIAKEIAPSLTKYKMSQSQ